MSSNINQWTQNVEPLVLDQYKESTHWLGILKATIDQLQIIDNDGIELSELLKLDPNNPPTGSRLDYIASLVNVKRNADETDTEFFSRFVSTLGRHTAGTPDKIIEDSASMSGDAHPVYHEETDAVFFVYTPNGRQLLRSEVKRLAPAGVLGVPGALVRFVSSDDTIDFIDETKMLNVAEDSLIGTDDEE